MKRPKKTPAAATRTSAAPVYPRPQLRRENWGSLDGRWDFAIDAEARFTRPGDVSFDRTILVPFAPETPKSGVNETGFYKAVWYRRTFTAPTLSARQRLVLHFGAVDYEAMVWVNGKPSRRHHGGYKS
jgi:beta-galactosidase/beta-glucuronidase